MSKGRAVGLFERLACSATFIDYYTYFSCSSLCCCCFLLLLSSRVFLMLVILFRMFFPIEQISVYILFEFLHLYNGTCTALHSPDVVSHVIYVCFPCCAAVAFCRCCRVFCRFSRVCEHPLCLFPLLRCCSFLSLLSYLLPLLASCSSQLGIIV